MKYNFNIKLTHKDLFDYSMNHTKSTKSYFFDIAISVVAILITIYYIITKKFFEMPFFNQLLLIFCCIMFTVIKPLIIYVKTSSQAKKLENHTINIEFNDFNIIATTDNERSETQYENVYNFIKYKNMVVLMYTSLLGQIIPNRYIDVNINDFFNDVVEKIKFAREKLDNDGK